jgi:NADH-quinone oxidoreductase subunit L
MMGIGNLALTGVGIPYLIGTSGFYSKDGIINAAFLSGTPVGTYAFVLTLTAALMTSFYSWRQFLMTFHGPYRGAAQHEHAHASAHSHHQPDAHDDHGHAVGLSQVHESPLTMLIPLLVLAVGALFAGMIFDHDFVGPDALGFWHGTVAAFAGHHAAGAEVPAWVEFGPFVALIVGFAIAYYYYVMHPEVPPQLAARNGFIYRFLYNKWYFDELYDFLLVRPTFRLARFLWKFGDGRIIDGLGPDGIAARVLDTSRGAVRIQTGYVYHYAFAMLAGVVVLAGWFIFEGGWR